MLKCINFEAALYIAQYNFYGGVYTHNKLERDFCHGFDCSSNIINATL